MQFSYNNRAEVFERFRSTKFDLIVIGGGITGAGIFVDAISRGLKVCLLDKGDFGSGTSSKSTKLIHGGLRYLKNRELKLVAEVGKERAIVHKNGPHLTVPEQVLVPATKKGTYTRLALKSAMMLYERLVKIPRRHKHRYLGKRGLLREEPGIHAKKARGGVVYTEYRTDDARLTLELIKTGVAMGGFALNYVEVTDFLYAHGIVLGTTARDLISGKEHDIESTYVVNSTGPWVDDLLTHDSEGPNKLVLSKGVHLVTDHSKFPIKKSIYFDVGDGRMIFAIPREGCTYFGTTDTLYEGKPENVMVTKSDATYLVDAVNQMFPEVKLELKDIESSWVGLRPLIFQPDKGPTELSRKDEIFESKSGLITIAGGKLTGYRIMAKKVVDIVNRKLEFEKGIPFLKCSTASVAISGSQFDRQNSSLQQKLEEAIVLAKVQNISTTDAEWLFSKYGTNTTKVLEMEEDHALITLPIYLAKALQYSFEYEQVISPLDFIERRLSLSYFNIELARKHGEKITTWLASKCNWDEEIEERMVAELNKTLKSASNFPEINQDNR